MDGRHDTQRLMSGINHLMDDNIHLIMQIVGQSVSVYLPLACKTLIGDPGEHKIADPQVFTRSWE